MKELNGIELIHQESFINYCFQSNSDDVVYWENWLKENSEHKKQVEELKVSILMLTAPVGKKVIDHDYQILRNSIGAKLKREQPAGHKVRLWPRIVAVAAMFLIVFGAGVYLYNSSHRPEQIAYRNDVVPGKLGARLTLANGHSILINVASAGNIAVQSGVKISKSADGQIIYEVTKSKTGKLEYNTLSTMQGEHVQVLLPDGSLVFLNAASSLRYPVSFGKQMNRRVFLTGEGYFEISKDKAHPFIVETKGQELSVLGTHFNINSYADEGNTKTTLLEGSVRVSLKQEEIPSPGNANSENPGKRPTQTIVLQPHQQSVLTANKFFVVKNVEVENVTDWKSNDFVFNGTDFKTAMRKIARWYNVEIIYDNDLPDDIEPGGWISRKNNLSVVLKRIESTGQVHFKIEGRRIRVTR